MKKLVTLLTLLCLSVWANAEKVKIDGIWYELESTGKTAEVTHDIGTNYSGEVVIPQTVTHGNVVYSVTSIGEDAFLYCSNLTGITIGNSVTSIGSWAFNKCSSLTSITIPNSVTSIGEYAFYDCPSLTSITIPNSVTSIGEQTFFGCSGLTSVTIGNSVKSIGKQAFSGCSSLTSITIPNSVTSIGEEAFDGCSGLTSIVVEEENTVYDSRENCNAIIETATNTLIFGCQSTVIPNSVTSIESRAFRGCSSLTSITIPNSVTSIGKRAFFGCEKLTDIYCHAEKVPSTSRNAFEGSNLDTLYVPQSAINDYKTTEPWSRFGCIKSLTDE